MDTSKSVLVIGAGIGGISTAIFLSQKGYKVDIYEKNNFPGGRCGQILRDGHRFDTGATILMMPSVYRDVFSSMGLNFDECFTLKELPSVYRVYFRSGESLAFSRDMEIMKTQVESFETGSFKHFRKYIADGYRFFRLAMRDLLGKNFYSLSGFITLKNMILLIRLKSWLRQDKYVKRFFKNPRLQEAFTFQNIYVGQSPVGSPALFAMLPAAELTEGALFPAGGMYSLVQKLVETAQAAGVNFHYGKTVSKIRTSGNKAESVLFTDGSTQSAEIIIANADLPYVYRDLLPDPKASEKIERKKYACSAMVFHWGLSKAFPQLGHHSVFLSGEFKSSLAAIFEKYSISGDPSFYVHSPVRTDQTAAPAGEDSLSVIIPMGHVNPKKDQNWNELVKTTRSAVLERLKEAGMDELEKHIKFEICFPPNTWESTFNVSKGSVFGSLKHSIMQMGYFRPHNRHKVYRNLYFTGGSTHPGNGVPLVLLSAKLTSERILKENPA